MYFEKITEIVNEKFQKFSQNFFETLSKQDEATGIMEKWESDFKDWSLPLNQEYDVNITWKAKLIDTIKEGKGRQVIALVIKRNQSNDEAKNKLKSEREYIFLTENGFWSGFEG